MLAVTASMLLTACGGNGWTETPRPPAPCCASQLRPLSAEFSTRKAVSYSGYRGADRSTVPSSADILQDLQLLVQGNFRLIRLFDSSDEHALKTLQVIKDNNLDIKVQLGIWISGPKATQDAANQAEIERGVALANTYKDIVLGVSVGNETMVDWSGLQVPPADMAAYISAVRARITQPVTTDDNWAFFANDQKKYDTDKVLSVVDYVSMHTYPLADTPWGLWDWQQASVPADQRAAAMMDAALAKAKKDYDAVATYVASKQPSMPIVIGETGWKSATTGNETQRAHPVNQKMYFDRMATWTNGPKAIFTFEAFDEPWKGGDDGWGLFDVNRLAKYVIYDLYPANQRETASYTLADAVHFIAAASNPRITANTYTLFADTVPNGAAVPAGPNTPLTVWQAWDNPATAVGALVSAGAAEGSTALEITPVPKSWGWGFFLQLSNPDDLTNFNSATGTLNFSIKTTYAGKLEVGFFTGSTTANTGVDVYLAIAPGQYGYVNDGAWHTVSVPVSAIAAKAAPAFGQPTSATLDMTKVSNGFVIADRYAVTGNAGGSTTKVQVDNIYWSK
ncbi:hypothetical protein GCM10025771_19700 [Niveibacterium umoris]|uniref:Endo-1,3-beta-glucanase btgC n=1 Tax=Niveibacterium umoris TaxID=1193620 RepID=A0A840BMG3_9RHOO|nr:glycosyl hydrolase family 17 protein [Niveibacterium umoris]MBB4012842.1 exo-beta-1,3-glucanase (GH17 family) [Niveibacterium umoris]